MLLLSYYCTFVNFPVFKYYNLLKYVFIVIIGIYIFGNIRIIKRKGFVGIHLLLIVFSAIVLYTSWINRGVVEERDPFLAAIVFLATLLESFLLMEITAVKGYTQSLINTYCFLTAVIAGVTDILALTGVDFDAIDGVECLVGTKFEVSYLHFLWICLYLTKNDVQVLRRGTKRLSLVLLSFLALGMALITDCVTGIVGIALLVIMLLIYQRHADYLYNPFVFLGVLGISFALSFLFELIIMWEPIEYIVVNYLNRDATMTSRTKIFALVPVLLRGHFLLGYGYGTTYELGRQLGGFPNTQNALWEWIWQTGVTGTIVLVILLYAVLHYTNKVYKQSKNSCSKYILILLYLLSLLASIEITINTAYLGYLAMMIPLICVSGGRWGMHCEKNL